MKHLGFIGLLLLVFSCSGKEQNTVSDEEQPVTSAQATGSCYTSLFKSAGLFEGLDPLADSTSIAQNFNEMGFQWSKEGFEKESGQGCGPIHGKVKFSRDGHRCRMFFEDSDTDELIGLLTAYYNDKLEQEQTPDNYVVWSYFVEHRRIMIEVKRIEAANDSGMVELKVSAPSSY